ncbi:MAG: hypothetical protein EO766_17670, partial [Hydrotalea sp. AMD]|uniref:hypothetical protein n=1 Tax=Hydrotalea sp. AMD TaxID=2501297 RepID=UPI0010276A94
MSVLVINSKKELATLRRAAQNDFDYWNDTILDDVGCDNIINISDKSQVLELRVVINERIENLVEATRLVERVNAIDDSSLP